ncbi:MAG: DivIVA domain-containing protein [Longimicrobiales bacterium]
MIDLTPVDVRKKKGDFRRSVRGYEAPAVDEFLDLVAERMEELVKQNVALSDRVGRMEEHIAEYKDRERALTEALVTAQEVREEVRRQAEKAAELVRREAHADAERIRNEALRTREQEEDGLRRVRARSGQFIESYRRFLEREIAELDVMAESLELREGGSAGRRGGEKAAGARPAEESGGRAGKKAAVRAEERGRANAERESSGAEPALFDAEFAEADREERGEMDAQSGEGGPEAAGDPDWLSSLRDERA